MSVIKVTKDNFEEIIGNNTVLLDFYADWCGPCRMVSPIVDEIANERTDITVGKVNVDEEAQIAAAFGIMSIPTLVLMKDGKPVATKIGLCSKEDILKLFEC